MVKVLVVDDERVIREGAIRVIEQCLPNAEITPCERPEEAIEAAGKAKYDIAFLDIQMPGMTGVELAKRIKRFLRKQTSSFQRLIRNMPERHSKYMPAVI